MDDIKIKKAELLAEFIHCGQKRGDGEDYINHCDRISSELEIHLLGITGNNAGSRTCLYEKTPEQENLICAAWLHDTMEDQTITTSGEFKQIILNVFGKEIYDLVCILTHDAWDSSCKIESYNDYITRVFQHPTAWQIKWLDMIDNTSYSIPEKQKTKYRDACIHLMAHGVIIPDILKERLEI